MRRVWRVRRRPIDGRPATATADPLRPAGGIAVTAEDRPHITLPDTEDGHIAQTGDRASITAIEGVRRRIGRTGDRPMDDEATTRVVRSLFDRFDGRFSCQVGIDVDDGDHEIERWFLASTLFGNRIDSNIAIRTYHVLDGLGLSTIDDVASCDRDQLVEFLDRGGYVRYDYRMASRLLALAENADHLLPGGVSTLGRTATDPERLRRALESLPGWGPITTRAFLRELRGVWPGADLPVDPLASRSALHIGLGTVEGSFDVATLAALATTVGVDVRDLEAALVRLAFAHHRSFDLCEARSPGLCELLLEEDQRTPKWPAHVARPAGTTTVVRIDSRRTIPRIVVPDLHRHNDSSAG